MLHNRLRITEEHSVPRFYIVRRHLNINGLHFTESIEEEQRHLRFAAKERREVCEIHS